MNEPRATVRLTEDGEHVLEDPDALEVIRAVGKHNCRLTLEQNAERVEHFKRRMAERGDSWAEVLIVVVSVDDADGGVLADALMPGSNWQQYRDRGEKPFARGLANRGFVQLFVDAVDREAGGKLRSTEGVAVVVVDCGAVEVFPG